MKYQQLALGLPLTPKENHQNRNKKCVERLLMADLRQPNTPNYPDLSVRYGIDSGYTF